MWRPLPGAWERVRVRLLLALLAVSVPAIVFACLLKLWGSADLGGGGVPRPPQRAHEVNPWRHWSPLYHWSDWSPVQAAVPAAQAQ